MLWSVQAMDVPAIAEVAFTSEDGVREVNHNFNADGFDSVAPKYAGGRPPKFTLPECQVIKKVALSRPREHNLPSGLHAHQMQAQAPEPTARPR